MGKEENLMSRRFQLFLNYAYFLKKLRISASTENFFKSSDFEYSEFLSRFLKVYNRPNRLRFVYTHFKSCDESLDKTSFDFSDIFHTMQSRAMNAKSRIKLKLPKSMVT